MARKAAIKKHQAHKPRVLVVDDEPHIRELIADLLADAFEPLLAENGSEALRIAKDEGPSLVLMDIMMPGINGIEACKALRNDPTTKHIPVIILSAAGDRLRRVEAFDSGADDFVSKPFDSEELVSRIHAKLRRAKEFRTSGKSVLVSLNLIVDASNKSVTINGDTMQLSALETKLLALLVKKKGQVTTRKEIMSRVWSGKDVPDRLIDAHIVALRKKIAEYHGGLKTIYGEGYSLIESRE